MNNLSYINKFFEISAGSNIFDEIFNILKDIIGFEYGCIYYTNPEKLIFDCGTNKNYKYTLSNDLKYKNTRFGKIVLHRETKFSQEETKALYTYSYIISNLIKDNEIAKIMKLQVEELQNGYREIKNAEKVKTDFISHVSHELRTPLNSIIGFSDMLESENAGKLNAKQKEFVNNIKVSGLTLLGMINEILDISKLESKTVSISPKKFNISELVFEIENIIKPLYINKNISFIKDISEFDMNADYMKILQINLNLLSNAIKFSPAGSEITLKIIKDKYNAIFSVCDNGIGIASKYHGKIFEKFEQVNKNIPNSTGLGLAIVKEFVAMHNGSINLESKLNKGTKFIVTIPLCFSKNML